MSKYLTLFNQVHRILKRRGQGKRKVEREEINASFGSFVQHQIEVIQKNINLPSFLHQLQEAILNVKESEIGYKRGSKGGRKRTTIVQSVNLVH